ncbi:leucine-rich repeat protein [Acetobacterium wieringae]|uniref:Leucine-rich repeat protein n=1 Tax=Acetobacterium wieringae TaxID=52694 RepID=A0A5D0WNV2_9FIRM|nr:triple tyrosine motif-containing protein [Acetobacterium wieringae]TYC85784.1 leucine-rich repeat protein [Acetobacterium wieringae]
MIKRINRWLSIMLVFMMVLTSMPLNLLAEDVSMKVAAQEIFTWTEVDGGVEITGYDIGSGGAAVEIPDTLAGKKVVGIGSDVFKDQVITSVEFSNNLLYLKEGAFNNCDDLMEIELPTSMTDIYSNLGNPTFGNCEKLVKVSIPKSVKMWGFGMFAGSPVEIYGVKDSPADDYAYEADLNFHEIEFLTVDDFQVSPASEIAVGNPITLTATTSGGAGAIRYDYFWDRINIDKTESTNNIASDTALSSVAFTPDTAGTYTFYVRAKDENGKTAQKTYENIIVTNEPVIAENGFKASKASPQYYDSEILLTVDTVANTGSGTLNYRFYYTTGEETQVLDDSVLPQATFRPDTPGLYNLYVEVTDQQGRTAKSEILNYSIVDDLAIKSFTASPDNSQTHPIGTTILLNAEGSGGKTAYQYRFFAIFEDGGEIPIQDFSTAATASFTPLKAGIYDLYLEIKNGSGKIVSEIAPETPAIIENMIITPVVTLTAAKDDGSPAYPEDQVSLNASVSGIKDTYTYSYAYSLDEGKTRTPIETGIAETVTDFLLPSAGNYRFYVDVIENGEVVAQAVSDNYPVLTRPSATLKSDKVSPQNRNTTVKFTASASGGKGPYTYQFACDRDGEDIYQGEAVATNTVSLPLNEAGEYTIKVIARDANGKEAEQATLVYEIRDNPLAQITTNPDQELTHYVGDEVILQADVDGGTAPFKYRFYYKLGSKTVELSDPDVNDKEASISFTPTIAGNYSFMVEVTDDNGLKTTATQTGYKVLAAVATKSFVTDKPSGQNVNTPIKLTANGSGGKTPYTYKFTYQLNDGGPVDVDENASSTTNTVLFEPTQVGTYTLNVEITDDNGKGQTTTKTIENYKIVNGPVIDKISAVNKADPETAIYVNDPILITAALKDGTGTGPIQYHFTIKNGTKVVKSVTQTDVNSLEFTPQTAGTYSVTIDVIDNDGLKATQILKNVVVLKTLMAGLKTDKASGTSINSAIKLSATATGGKSPYTYTYEWEDASGSIGSIPAELTAKTAALTFYTPEDVGLYTLRVIVTDANGKQAVSEIAGYQIKNPPIIDDFTVLPEKGTAVYPGEDISLTAEVQENSGQALLSYAFYVNGSKEKIVDDDSDPTTVVYKPLSGGTYTFEVVVSDGVSSVSKKITSYKVNTGLEVTSLKASKTDGVIIGDTIQLTAAGKGGVAPYTYQFSYEIKDDEENVIKAETDISPVDNKLKTISFDKFDQVGNYTFYVEITDKNGMVSLNSVEKHLAVTVTDPPIITGLVITDPDEEEELNSSYEKEEIKLIANKKPEAGGENLTYSFSYKVGSKSETIDAADVTENVASFTPPVAGTYTFYVSARDEGTGLTSATYTRSKFVVLKTFGVKSLKTSKPTGQDINTEIKLTATPDGGQAPFTYAFYQKLREDKLDTIDETDYAACLIPSDKTKNYATFKPASAGTYILLVAITDAKGNTATESIDFDINNPPVVTLTTDQTGQPVYVKDTVELTATVASDTGIGDLDYRFYWTRGAEKGDLDTTSEEDRVAQAEFIPEEAGTYNLFVEVTDEKNVSKTAKISSFKVLGDVSVKSLVVDKKTPQNIGTLIKLTATGTGGKTPYKYQFYYQRDSLNDEDDVADWEKIGSSTTSKTVSYRPMKPGLYSFKVEITDANKIVSSSDEETALLSDYLVVDPPVIRSFTVSPTGKQYEDVPVTLTTTVAGGSGVFDYEFYYQLEKEERQPITEEDDETPGTISFKPEEAGTYKFFVVVTDNENGEEDSISVEKTINRYTVVKTAAVKDFTINKTSMALGSSVRLSATGQEGIKPYYYQFSMKKEGDSEETIIRAFSTTYYYSYKPSTAGTYTFYVDIKDSKNETISRSEIQNSLEVN